MKKNLKGSPQKKIFPSIKILLADDHQVVRQGFRQILEASLPDVHFFEVESGTEVIEAVIGEPWNLVILDINMPGRNGIDVLKAIKKASPVTSVLILSMCPEEQFGVRALKAGASGYLSKGCNRDEMLDAVNTILAGDIYVSPQLSKVCVVNMVQPALKEDAPALSDREMEIARLIALGQSLKEIASDLSLSPKTVSSYRARVLEKLKVQSTAEIVRWAIENKLAE